MPDPQPDEFAAATEPTRRTKLLVSAEKNVKSAKLLLGAALALFVAGAGAISWVGSLAKAADLQRTAKRVDALEEGRKADHESLAELKTDVHQVLDQVFELSRFLRAPLVVQSRVLEQAVPAVPPPKKP